MRRRIARRTRCIDLKVSQRHLIASPFQWPWRMHRKLIAPRRISYYPAHLLARTHSQHWTLRYVSVSPLLLSRIPWLPLPSSSIRRLSSVPSCNSSYCGYGRAAQELAPSITLSSNRNLAMNDRFVTMSRRCENRSNPLSSRIVENCFPVWWKDRNFLNYLNYSSFLSKIVNYIANYAIDDLAHLIYNIRTLSNFL